MRTPSEVQIAAPNAVAVGVSHRVHPVDADRKRDLLLHVLAAYSRLQTLVFARTKHGSDKLCRYLEQHGFRAAAIHGNKSQNQRTRALADFKRGSTTILVATDIAARGLDIDQLPAVVNYDLPMVAQDYVHRIGRTGRAGAEGLALSLVSREEEGLLRDIQKLLKQPLAIESVQGFEPAWTPRPERTNVPATKPAQRRNPRGRKTSGWSKANKPSNAKRAAPHGYAHPQHSRMQKDVANANRPHKNRHNRNRTASR